MRRLEKTQGPDEHEVQAAISEYEDLRETTRTRAILIQQILDI